ncbi:MAG: hypothetical protein Ct9H90mP6_04830 [Gammaproteobacteria bacterium]|nr:MAG: hypothetical protein Ct9H90mP6_04830 [Gammaproteobacteria bacterium]
MKEGCFRATYSGAHEPVGLLIFLINLNVGIYRQKFDEKLLKLSPGLRALW